MKDNTKGLEKKVMKVLQDDVKAPYEIAQLLRLKRKIQLLKLKDTINQLYTDGKIETIKINEVTKVYVK